MTCMDDATMNEGKQCLQRDVTGSRCLEEGCGKNMRRETSNENHKSGRFLSTREQCGGLPLAVSTCCAERFTKLAGTEIVAFLREEHV